MIECRSCRLVWVEPREPSGAFDEEYFRRNYCGRPDAFAEFFRMELAFLGPPGRLLDVGCGTGTFLREALDRGWECAGIDVSPFAIDRARDLLGDRARLIRGDFCSASVPETGFDLVTFWDVLAHLPDPGRALERAHRLLHPGGFVALRTPVRPAAFFRFVSRLGPGLWRLRRSLVGFPARVFHFTGESIRRALQMRGFEPVRERIEPAPPGPQRRWKDWWRHPRGTAHRVAGWLLELRYPQRSLVVHARRLRESP